MGPNRLFSVSLKTTIYQLWILPSWIEWFCPVGLNLGSPIIYWWNIYERHKWFLRLTTFSQSSVYAWLIWFACLEFPIFKWSFPRTYLFFRGLQDPDSNRIYLPRVSHLISTIPVNFLLSYVIRFFFFQLSLNNKNDSETHWLGAIRRLQINFILFWFLF